MPTSPQTLAPIRQKLCLSFCLQSPPPSPVAGLWMQLRCSENPLNLNMLLVTYLQCNTLVTPVALPCH